MSQIIAAAITCLCLPIYLVAGMNSLRQLMRQEVVITKWSLSNMRMLRLTGTPALIYGFAQLVSAVTIVSGLMNGLANGSLGTIFLSFIIGWAIGVAGSNFAQNMKTGVEVVEPTSGPTTIQGVIVNRFVDTETIYAYRDRGETLPPEIEDEMAGHNDNDNIEDANYRMIDDNPDEPS